MELNKIRIILDDSGSIDSLVTPVINQYATNYLVEVAFKNEYEDNRIYKVVFNINGKESPAKVLAPTDRYYDFEDGTKSAHFWEYKLTQYETQFYQDALDFSLIVENEAGIITTQKISLVMNKQRFNKLTPVNLESDTSLNSVVLSISDLDKVIDSRINTSEIETLEEVNRLDGVVRTDLTNRIIRDIDTVHTRIDGVEDYYNSEIERIDTDINAKESMLRLDIMDAVSSAAQYTDNTVNAYDSYAQDTFLKKEDTYTTVNPYIEEKYYDSLRYTDYKINELVDTAPETLDTLKEIADALKDQDDVITAIETTIGEKADRSELEGKLDKVTSNTGGYRVYAITNTGDQTTVRYSGSIMETGTIITRFTDGNINVPLTPTEDNYATSKKYVDTNFQEKLLAPTTYSRIPAFNDQGTITWYYRDQSLGNVNVVGVGSAFATYRGSSESPNINDTNKRHLITSSPTKDFHCANKKYVDTSLNGAVVEITDAAVTLDMNSNTEYRCTAETGITALNITSFIAAPSGVAEEWSIIFKTGSSITVEFPTNVKWAVAAPIFETSKTYMITFIRFGEYYLGVWTVEA